MATVSLNEAKAHLRVSASSEDSLIQLYMAAADDWIANFLNVPIPGSTDSPVDIPSAIKAAALLIIGDLYENRQATMEKQPYNNPSVMALLQPYRDDMGV